MPKYPGKFGKTPLFSASDFFDKSLVERKKLPENAIIVYSRVLFSKLKADLKLEDTDYPYSGLFDESVNADRSMLVVKLYPGAPLTAATIEELSSLGVENVLLLGTAGSISSRARINDIMVCSRALRDEGTSYHYMRSSDYSYPSRELTSDLKAAFREKGHSFHTGPTWTTDAPYMETVEEIKKYASMGILTVEMEAAAAFAVARMRGLKAAAVFSVSDELHGDSWTGIYNPESGFRKLTEFAGIFAELQTRK